MSDSPTYTRLHAIADRLSEEDAQFVRDVAQRFQALEHPTPERSEEYGRLRTEAIALRNDLSHCGKCGFDTLEWRQRVFGMYTGVL